MAGIVATTLRRRTFRHKLSIDARGQQDQQPITMQPPLQCFPSPPPSANRTQSFRKRTPSLTNSVFETLSTPVAPPTEVVRVEWPRGSRLHYKDFWPNNISWSQVDPSYIEFETFDVLIPRANAWLEENPGNDVIKCETVERKCWSLENIASGSAMFDKRHDGRTDGLKKKKKKMEDKINKRKKKLHNNNSNNNININNNVNINKIYINNNNNNSNNNNPHHESEVGKSKSFAFYVKGLRLWLIRAQDQDVNDTIAHVRSRHHRRRRHQQRHHHHHHQNELDSAINNSNNNIANRSINFNYPNGKANDGGGATGLHNQINIHEPVNHSTAHYNDDDNEDDFTFFSFDFPANDQNHNHNRANTFECPAVEDSNHQLDHHLLLPPPPHYHHHHQHHSEVCRTEAIPNHPSVTVSAQDDVADRLPSPSTDSFPVSHLENVASKNKIQTHLLHTTQALQQRHQPTTAATERRQSEGGIVSPLLFLRATQGILKSSEVSSRTSNREPHAQVKFSTQLKVEDQVVDQPPLSPPQTQQQPTLSQGDQASHSQDDLVDVAQRGFVKLELPRLLKISPTSSVAITPTTSFCEAGDDITTKGVKIKNNILGNIARSNVCFNFDKESDDEEGDDDDDDDGGCGGYNSMDRGNSRERLLAKGRKESKHPSSEICLSVADLRIKSTRQFKGQAFESSLDRGQDSDSSSSSSSSNGSKESLRRYPSHRHGGNFLNLSRTREDLPLLSRKDEFQSKGKGDAHVNRGWESHSGNSQQHHHHYHQDRRHQQQENHFYHQQQQQQQQNDFHQQRHTDTTPRRSSDDSRIFSFSDLVSDNVPIPPENQSQSHLSDEFGFLLPYTYLEPMYHHLQIQTPYNRTSTTPGFNAKNEASYPSPLTKRPVSIGYINVIPRCLSQESKYPVYETLPETYSAINNYLIGSPLEGRIVTIETMAIKLPVSTWTGSLVDPDKTFYLDEYLHHTLNITRIYFIHGTKVQELIGAQDFLPEVVSDSRCHGITMATKYGGVETAVERANLWMRSARNVRITNVQTLEAALRKSPAEGLYTGLNFVDKAESNMRIRFLRITYVCPRKGQTYEPSRPYELPPTLGYKTFVPAACKVAMFSGAPCYESLQVTWERARAWLKHTNCGIISAETFYHPIRDLWDKQDGGETTVMRGDWSGTSRRRRRNPFTKRVPMVQVIRVYMDGVYQDPPSNLLPPPPMVREINDCIQCSIL